MPGASKHLIRIVTKWVAYSHIVETNLTPLIPNTVLCSPVLRSGLQVERVIKSHLCRFLVQDHCSYHTILCLLNQKAIWWWTVLLVFCDQVVLGLQLEPFGALGLFHMVQRRRWSHVCVMKGLCDAGSKKGLQTFLPRSMVNVTPCSQHRSGSDFHLWVWIGLYSLVSLLAIYTSENNMEIGIFCLDPLPTISTFFSFIKMKLLIILQSSGFQKM